MTAVLEELSHPSAGGGPGPLLIVDIPATLTRHKRTTATKEIWPGARDAAHMRI